jgi:hypothetical protein
MTLTPQARAEVAGMIRDEDAALELLQAAVKALLRRGSGEGRSWACGMKWTLDRLVKPSEPEVAYRCDVLHKQRNGTKVQCIREDGHPPGSYHVWQTCFRSHPHERMSGECEILTKWARQDNAEAGAVLPTFALHYSCLNSHGTDYVRCDTAQGWLDSGRSRIHALECEVERLKNVLAEIASAVAVVRL